jgi:L-seryl-tRNA(Ser) seleniumtransferase
MSTDLLRSLPSIDMLLNHESIVPFYEILQRQYVKNLIQYYLERLRRMIMSDELPVEEKKEIIENIIPSLMEYLALFASDNYKRVINATGIILHTNLGRAPLCESAVNKLGNMAGYYLNLEYNLVEGMRGERDEQLQELFQLLINAPASIIVNNNAAAMLLMLNTFADGREVIVSRGELIEIGASFRLPDIFKKSGAILKEVGTTNKTKISDYESAFTEHTEAVMRVNPSNYEIIGFTEKPSLAELVALAKKHGYYLFKDLGSGNILDLSEIGFGSEPNAKDAMQLGVDLVAFSGDKILGGPQCGIICGKENLINKMRNNPLYRALRTDRLTSIALEATLRCYMKGNHFKEIIPLRMISTWLAELKIRVKKFLKSYEKNVKTLNVSPAFLVDSATITSYSGGGFAPGVGLESFGIAISSERLKSNEIHSILRLYKIPIIGRVENDKVLLDFRTVLEEEEPVLLQALLEMQKALSVAAVPQPVTSPEPSPPAHESILLPESTVASVPEPVPPAEALTPPPQSPPVQESTPSPESSSSDENKVSNNQ